MKPVMKLEGVELDAAVAKAEGINFVVERSGRSVWVIPDESEIVDLRPWRWCPSEDWEQGGPIIERERIGTVWNQQRLCWEAFHAGGNDGFGSHGFADKPLIAAMRAYVASKSGT